MTTRKKPQQTVKIGPHTYRVVEIERLQDRGNYRSLCGQIDFRNLTIEIEKGLVGTYKRQTLFHEIIHGVLENAGIRGDHDEQVVDAIATGIVQVLQDNEWLRR
jgi:hypothetical protein